MSILSNNSPRPRFAPPYCCGPYPEPAPQPPRPRKKKWCPCRKPRPVCPPPRPCCNPCCNPCYNPCDPCGMCEPPCMEGQLRKTLIPAVLGDDSKDSDYAPANVLFFNSIVEYHANVAVYVYVVVCILTKIKDGRPKEETN